MANTNDHFKTPVFINNIQSTIMFFFGRHDIAEILLKVALNTKIQINYISFDFEKKKKL
jgi:hypothetical protein